MSKMSTAYFVGGQTFFTSDRAVTNIDDQKKGEVVINLGVDKYTIKSHDGENFPYGSFIVVSLGTKIYPPDRSQNSASFQQQLAIERQKLQQKFNSELNRMRLEFNEEYSQLQQQINPEIQKLRKECEKLQNDLKWERKRNELLTSEKRKTILLPTDSKRKNPSIVDEISRDNVARAIKNSFAPKVDEISRMSVDEVLITAQPPSVPAKANEVTAKSIVNEIGRDTIARIIGDSIKMINTSQTTPSYDPYPRMPVDEAWVPVQSSIYADAVPEVVPLGGESSVFDNPKAFEVDGLTVTYYPQRTTHSKAALITRIIHDFKTSTNSITDLIFEENFVQLHLKEKKFLDLFVKQLNEILNKDD